MSTAIERIEKKYLINWLYNEQIPLVYIRKGEEYHFFIEKQTKDTLYLKSDHVIPDVEIGEQIDLLFDFKGKTISCSFQVKSKPDLKNHKHPFFLVNIPETLHKDLERSFVRVPFPDTLQMEFIFDDWHQLPCPKLDAFDIPQETEPLAESNVRDLHSVITELNLWAKEYSDGIKAVLFKDTKQISPEEQVIIKTGKTLFLPSTQGPFIEKDPFLPKKLITKAMFKAYLKSIGENPLLLDRGIDRFLQSLYENGILSAIWIPLFFHEYVVGYIHVWITTPNKPLDYAVLEKLFMYARMTVSALESKGYFECYRVKQDFRSAQGITISPSGLSFSFDISGYMPALLPKRRLIIKLLFPNYTAEAAAQIVRWEEEKSSITIICQFLELGNEILSRLFTFLYGRTLRDPGASLVVGAV
ncbi:MAG: hypothetical protein LBD29_04350 [Treponema sp.]|jgi:hypothetical protein|nr:hypothetical protein [Treponema sp.]